MPIFGPPDVDKLKAKRDIAGLIKALSFKQAHIREAAARALGDIGASQAWSALYAASKDNDVLVRQSAASALEMLEPLSQELRVSADPEELLTALRCAKEATSRRSIAMRLQALGWQPRDDAAGALYFIALEDWDACVRIGANSVQPLCAALGYPDWSIRESATKALGQIGDARAVDPLIERLMEDGDWAREAAASALVAIGDARGVAMAARVQQGEVFTTRAFVLRVPDLAASLRVGIAQLVPLFDALIKHVNALRIPVSDVQRRLSGECPACGTRVPGEVLFAATASRQANAPEAGAPSAVDRLRAGECAVGCGSQEIVVHWA